MKPYAVMGVTGMIYTLQSWYSAVLNKSTGGLILRRQIGPNVRLFGGIPVCFVFWGDTQIRTQTRRE